MIDLYFQKEDNKDKDNRGDKKFVMINKFKNEAIECLRNIQ